MIVLASNSNKIGYGIKHYNCDTIADFNELKKKTSPSPGSTCFIIATSQYYMLNSKKEWIKVNLYCGSINSEDDDSSTPSDGIYDGGSIDGSDPV